MFFFKLRIKTFFLFPNLSANFFFFFFFFFFFLRFGNFPVNLFNFNFLHCLQESVDAFAANKHPEILACMLLYIEHTCNVCILICIRFAFNYTFHRFHLGPLEAKSGRRYRPCHPFCPQVTSPFFWTESGEMIMKNFSSPPVDPINPLTTKQPAFYGTDEHQTIIVVLLSLVMALGFIANSAVICALSQRQKQSASVTNYLLMNISIADLLIAVIVMPLQFVNMFHGWPLGKFLCHTLAAFQDVIACVSVVIHTVIAMERYRAIVQPFKQRLSIRRTKQAIVITWLVCYVAVGLPMALVLRVLLRGHTYRCEAQWSSDWTRQLFEVYLVVLFILTPLMAQTYAYIYIVKTVSREIVASADQSNDDSKRLMKAALSKARVVKMLIILVAAFYLLSLPRIFTMLIMEFGGYSIRNNLGFQYAVTVTIVIYCIKYVINPFIIFASSAELRTSCCLVFYRN